MRVWRNGRRRGLRKLSTWGEIPRVNGVKFGETSARNGGGNPELRPVDVSTSKILRQMVTIRTQELYVLNSVVESLTVDVVYF